VTDKKKGEKEVVESRARKSKKIVQALQGNFPEKSQNPLFFAGILMTSRRAASSNNNPRV